MKTHVMIDMETLSTAVDTVVVSIGLVKFTKDGISESLQVNLPTIPQLSKLGRTISIDTVVWWANQGDEARKQLKAGEKNKYKEEMHKVYEFIANCGDDVIVWSNGATFDIPILDHQFDQLGVKSPWKYFNAKCFRTITNLYWSKLEASYKNNHSAVEDAKNQANHLISLQKITDLPIL